MFLYSQAGDVPPWSPDYTGNHHPRHVLVLKRKADAVGVPCETWLRHLEPMLPPGAMPGDLAVDFLIRQLAGRG